jgi:aminopeptidase N
MRSARFLFAIALVGASGLFVPTAAGAPTPLDPIARCGAGETAGALGVGDPYYPRYGNGGYDVQHYDLAVRYGPARNHLRGVATIEAVSTQTLTCFSLDLVGLTVHVITVDGSPATWSRTDHELLVTPPQPVPPGNAFTIVATYDGVPRTFQIPDFGVPAGFMATRDGAIVAGEPEAATAWFPVNDHPVDRASYTFRVTVPTGYDVVANGVRESRTTIGGWTTHVWQADDPMASYLATIDIGDWKMRFRQTETGLPIIDAVDPDVYDDVKASLRREPEIVSFLESQFGPYPFGSVGAIVPDSRKLAFALETQTRPVYSRYFFPFGGDFVIVHELAHQWFGDLVAVDRWQHVWLNEGFATYAEWLWNEHEGFATPQEILESLWHDIGPRSSFWWVVVGDPGVADLFDGAVYLRGAMTLQALRNEVGDDAFWTILHSWTEMNAFGTGTTEEFIALSEQLSGQDLGNLFDLWLFTPSRPPASAVTGSGVVSVSPKVTRHVTSWLRSFERRSAP